MTLRHWLRIHDYVTDAATCVLFCSYNQVFVIVYNLRCLLLGLDELVGCVRSAVYFVVVDGELNRCLLGLVVLGQHYVLAFCVV